MNSIDYNLLDYLVKGRFEMFSIPIRDTYSHNDTKPRMFDVVIDEDGDIFIVTKNGNGKHILMLNDVEQQIQQYFPGFHLSPFTQRPHKPT